MEMSGNHTSEADDASSVKEIGQMLDMTEPHKIRDSENREACSDYHEIERSKERGKNTLGPMLPPDVPAHSGQRIQNSELQDITEMSLSRNSHSIAHQQSADQIPSATTLPQYQLSGMEIELLRLRKEIVLRDRRICDQDNLIAEQQEVISKSDAKVGETERRLSENKTLLTKQEDIIMRKDSTFNEQVDLLHRQYEQMHDKDERIRRLEAEGAILKNENLKWQRELVKQVSLPQPQSPYVHARTRTKGSTGSTFAQSLPRRPRSAPSFSVSAISSAGTRQVSDQESIFGVPLSALPATSLEITPTISRSTTMPAMPNTLDSRPPLSRMPRSLSTRSLPLAPVPEVSPPPTEERRPLSTQTALGTNTAGPEKDGGGRKSIKGAFAKVFKKVKGFGIRKNG